jgi:hypothetical protein
MVERTGCTRGLVDSPYFLDPDTRDTLTALLSRADVVPIAADFVVDVGVCHPAGGLVAGLLDQHCPADLRQVLHFMVVRLMNQAAEWSRTHQFEHVYRAWQGLDWKAALANGLTLERMLDLACDESIPISARAYLSYWGAGAAAQPVECILKVLDLLSSPAPRSAVIRGQLVDRVAAYLEDSDANNAEIVRKAVPLFEELHRRDSDAAPGVAARIASCWSVTPRIRSTAGLTAVERARLCDSAARILANELSWSATNGVLRAPRLRDAMRNLSWEAAATHFEMAEAILRGSFPTGVRVAALGMLAPEVDLWRRDPQTAEARTVHVRRCVAVLKPAFAKEIDPLLIRELALSLCGFLDDDPGIVPLLEESLLRGRVSSTTIREVIAEWHQGRKR